MLPCPADSTNRSRSGHFGLRGLCLRCFCHSTYAMGAAPMGSPGWPELAFWTASMARVRMVLMASWSRSGVGGIAPNVIRPPALPHRLHGREAGGPEGGVEAEDEGEGEGHDPGHDEAALVDDEAP